MSFRERLAAAFGDSFMQPEAFRGADMGPLEVIEAGLDFEEVGVYCRLSASGFLNCTDWAGPFESLEEAADYLIETYGNEEETQ